MTDAQMAARDRLAAALKDKVAGAQVEIFAQDLAAINVLVPNTDAAPGLVRGQGAERALARAPTRAARLKIHVRVSDLQAVLGALPSVPQ